MIILSCSSGVGPVSPWGAEGDTGLLREAMVVGLRLLGVGLKLHYLMQ